MTTTATETEETAAEKRDVGRFERACDSAVLSLMLCEPGGYPWSREELARTLGDQIDAFDAIERLREAGLVHRMGEFVFPTLACRRADELDFR
jgi:hypothetical protein